jgi:hypothetical protein
MNWNRNKSFAIGLIITLIVFTIILFANMSFWVSENNKLSEPRTFHIPFGANYGQNALNKGNNTYDFVIDLTITCPKNTLMVDDIVTIQGIAVIYNQPQGFSINDLIISFENAEAYPSHQTDNITDSLSIHLTPVSNNCYSGNGQCLWALEGTYHMGINLVGWNSSGPIFFPTAYCQNVALTVYPKSEMANIVTNTASMTLTFALYALTVIGSLGLFLTLWDRLPPNTNSNNNGTRINSNSTKDNDEPDNKIIDGNGASKEAN